LVEQLRQQVAPFAQATRELLETRPMQVAQEQHGDECDRRQPARVLEAPRPVDVQKVLVNIETE
jgi:hypothetical protein